MSTNDESDAGYGVVRPDGEPQAPGSPRPAVQQGGESGDSSRFAPPAGGDSAPGATGEPASPAPSSGGDSAPGAAATAAFATQPGSFSAPDAAAATSTFATAPSGSAAAGASGEPAGYPRAAGASAGASLPGAPASFDPRAGASSGPGAAGEPSRFAPQASGSPVPDPTSAPASYPPPQRPAGSAHYTAVPQAPAGYAFDRAAQPPAPGNQESAPEPSKDGPPLTPVAAPSASTPSRSRRGPGWGGVIVTSTVVALLAAGGAVAATNLLDDEPVDQATTSSVPTAIATGPTTQTVTSAGTSPDWEAVTAAVSNAVVAITVAVDEGTAVGSGVIYDSAGHIITNHHVVASATQIQVTLADGRIYEAELTGTDAATDLAVIELVDAPDDLTVARFGDSDTLVTGQDVLAIGNPLGLSSTATTGVISALNRPVVTTQEDTTEDTQQQTPGMPGPLGNLLGQDESSTTETFTNAIQVDAAINPGNSGGPLFDETGAVIGITSSIATMSSSSETGGSIGIGFSIPSNLAAKVADQLIETGTATHAYLGVSTGTGGATVDGVTRAGAEVGAVEADSPAEEAGVQEGDVIVAIDGKATSQAAALTGFVRQYSAGDTVTLTLVRDGEEMEIEVTLAERTDS